MACGLGSGFCAIGYQREVFWNILSEDILTALAEKVARNSVCGLLLCLLRGTDRR